MQAVFAQTGLSAADFAKVVLYAHEERHQIATATLLGFKPGQIQKAMYNDIGNTGCAAAPLWWMGATRPARCPCSRTRYWNLRFQPRASWTVPQAREELDVVRDADDESVFAGKIGHESDVISTACDPDRDRGACPGGTSSAGGCRRPTATCRRLHRSCFRIDCRETGGHRAHGVGETGRGVRQVDAA